MKYWYKDKQYENLEAVVDEHCYGKICNVCSLCEFPCYDIEGHETEIAKQIGAVPDLCEPPQEVKPVPYICAGLGVSPGQAFFIEGMPGVEFKVKDDGTFKTKPKNVVGSCNAFLRAVEKPEMVIRMTKEDAQKIVDNHKAANPLLRQAMEVLGK